MDRRRFFRSGLKDITDALVQRTPEQIRPKIVDPAYDVSILTSRPLEAEELAHEFLRDYFGEKMLRLKQAELEGTYPGYVVAFEDCEWLDTASGINMFATNIRELARELGVSEPQENPVHVRFVNKTPPLSRDVSIYRGDELVRELPLGEESEIEITGKNGIVKVRTSGGRCSITEAPEQDASAVAHPPIVTPGQRIICPHAKVTAVLGPVVREE